MHDHHGLMFSLIQGTYFSTLAKTVGVPSAQPTLPKDTTPICII